MDNAIKIKAEKVLSGVEGAPHRHAEREIIKLALEEAEASGYQRGKEEDEALLGRPVLEALGELKWKECQQPTCEFGHFMDMCAERSGGFTYQCNCDEEFTNLDDFAAHQQKYIPSVQPPCEWEDLKDLSVRELRERLRSRAETYKFAIRALSWRRDTFKHDNSKHDINILIDLILAKELAITQEAERLWSEHLDSFECMLDTAEGNAQIVKELGPNYLPVIMDRRAAKRLREAE